MMLLFLAPPWPSSALISYILSAARVINGLTPRKNLLPMGLSAK
jgi:hypothetical protein